MKNDPQFDYQVPGLDRSALVRKWDALTKALQAELPENNRVWRFVREVSDEIRPPSIAPTSKGSKIV